MNEPFKDWEIAVWTAVLVIAIVIAAVGVIVSAAPNG